MSDFKWEPHVPRCPQLRIRHTSCCGEYELASEGGLYFVLRPTADGGHEATARRLFAEAVQVYVHLAFQHRCDR
ncbi:hypothetical protein SMD20_34480 [Nonomuraea sp. LP-02]|uniref:hypothetical protein n=1 Tax=Nonomuraea sp. LP-02 TaxID=3097960 RepID=UPI002E353203|nr:hypothetical protein [Nonomuraea sp. LP-02]MED7929393.1 hypothetical protein [Nonomuraea sp. LP-02]